MSSVNVVSGEAVESDGEDVPKGSTVTGEAPESDDESEPRRFKISPPDSSSHFSSPGTDRTSNKSYNSLLHKKLMERNKSLDENMTNLIRGAVETSLVQLSSVDRQLLRSQLKLQQAAITLKALESNSVQLAERLSIAACSAYLPQISIPIPDN